MDDAGSSKPKPTLSHSAEDRTIEAIYSGDATKMNAALGDTDWLLEDLQQADVERFLRGKILPEPETLIRDCDSQSKIDVLRGLQDLRNSITDGLLPAPTQRSHSMKATLTSSLRDGYPDGGTTENNKQRGDLGEDDPKSPSTTPISGSVQPGLDEIVRGASHFDADRAIAKSLYAQLSRVQDFRRARLDKVRLVRLANIQALADEGLIPGVAKGQDMAELRPMPQELIDETRRARRAREDKANEMRDSTTPESEGDGDGDGSGDDDDNKEVSGASDQ